MSTDSNTKQPIIPPPSEEERKKLRDYRITLSPRSRTRKSLSFMSSNHNRPISIELRRELSQEELEKFVDLVSELNYLKLKSPPHQQDQQINQIFRTVDYLKKVRSRRRRRIKSSVDAKMFVAKSTRKHLILLTISLWFAERCRLTDCQVVSHGLRRLAISTNHFGLDVLRSLDKIEPHDKVIVFCPLCLSSSLAMIIMGSSRYEVISSLRHALYIWSMRPKDINQAYLDMFNHVGLNQVSTINKRKRRAEEARSRPIIHDETGVYGRERRSVNIDKSQESFSLYHSHRNGHQSWSLTSDESNQFSLPKLMYLREKSFDNLLPNMKSNKFVHGRDTPIEESLGSIKHNHHNRETIASSTLSQMASIQSIYIQRGINIDYNYQSLLRHFYKTIVHPVNFLHNGEETRQHINSLVASNTEGKIKDIILSDKIHQKPIAMLLVSAFHFRGTLDVFMKESRSLINDHDTNCELRNFSNFTSSPSCLKHQLYPRSLPNSSNNIRGNIRKKNAPMFIETESTLLKYGANRDLDCKTIEIPFKNRLISLVIVMPNHSNSTSLLMSKLNAQVLADMINSLEVQRLAIQIPVIKFDRGPTNVEGALRELGLSDIFYGDRHNKFNETGLNRWLRSNDIIHETSIDIGTINPKYYQAEDRLKVGASSKVKLPIKGLVASGLRRARSRQEATLIKLSGPFLYFVLDGINGLILAMGRVRQ